MIIELMNQYFFPILFLTGFAAGTVDAIAGGGGLITVPVLLSLGIPPHVVLGTNKLQSLFGTAVATYRYHKQGWLQREGLILGLIFSFIGAVIGSVSSQYIQSDILKKVIPLLLLFVLIYTIFTPKLGMNQEKPKMKESSFYFVFGTLLGFYDGFLGPGTGSFWVFMLVYFLGHSLVKATAYTKIFNLNTNITAMICFAIGNNIDYKIGFCMAIGQVLGGHLGAHLAIKKGLQLIRPIFIVVVSLTIATLVYKNYIQTGSWKIIFTDSYKIYIGILLILIIAGLSYFIFRRKKP